MFKFALIAKVSGTSPETYSEVFENKESYNLFAGTESIETASLLVASLLEKEIEEINLCGTFDDEETETLRSVGKDKIEIFNAKYSTAEMEKLSDLKSLKEYGFISITKNIDKLIGLDLLSEECNTRIMLVKDLDMACKAAEQLLDNGIQLIELCSWFDNEKTKKISDAIKGKVPVGSCGLIY